MEKFKAYFVKHQRHNKSTIEQVKDRLLKSKSYVLDSRENAPKNVSSHDYISRSSAGRREGTSNNKKKGVSHSHNHSLQQLNEFKTEIKNLIKPFKNSRYETSGKEEEKESVGKMKEVENKKLKFVKSNMNIELQLESGMSIEKRKKNKSENNLDSIYFRRGNGLIRSNQTSNQTPSNNKPNNKSDYYKNPYIDGPREINKKRSKSAQVENKKSKEDKEKKDKVQKTKEKSVINNEKYIIKTQSMFKTRKGVQISNPNKVNQDRFFIKEDEQVTFNKKISMYAVADGHGPNGHCVSNLIIENLNKKTEGYLKQNKTMKGSLERAFHDMQSLLIKNSDFNADFSGSTLVTVVIENCKKVFCANAGDSRAIVARQCNKYIYLVNRNNWEVIRLSNDHKPDLPEEKKRILSFGGRVETVYDETGKSIGPFRVWLPKKPLQGLAMSRSLGDNISKPIGVTHEPEILTHELNHEDKFILVASDGVWEFLTNYQILSLIIPYYRENRLGDACEALLKEAYKSWTTEDNSIVDDITFILIFLSSESTEEKIEKNEEKGEKEIIFQRPNSSMERN